MRHIVKAHHRHLLGHRQAELMAQGIEHRYRHLVACDKHRVRPLLGLGKQVARGLPGLQHVIVANRAGIDALASLGQTLPKTPLPLQVGR